MNELCLTKPFNGVFSGCLTENPDCPFAVGFGFSFHCTHPDRHRFAAAAASLHQGELLERYGELRDRRRQAFLDQLGMPIEECLEMILDRIRTEPPAGTAGEPRRRDLLTRVDHLPEYLIL